MYTKIQRKSIRFVKYVKQSKAPFKWPLSLKVSLYISRCKHYIKRPGLDVWGKNYTVNNLPSYDCVNCQKTIASTRYAPHLEKCLGLAGRQSSRVASRRIGGSPFSSDDNHSPDSDHDRNKKKKHVRWLKQGRCIENN